MAFCVQCGAQVDAKFCQACGAVNPAFAGAASAPPPVSQINAGGLAENMACALCYLLGLITGILFLVLAPYNQNPKIRFHAFQSIFFNLAWIGLSMAISFMAMMTTGALFMLYPLLSLGGFGLWLYLMYQAYNNQQFVLPVIGPLAQQQAGVR